MPLVTEDVVILQGFPFGETSRILRLLTRQHGVQSVIAKGALRPRSRFGGVLDPFSQGVATFYLKPGRDLHTLGGFDLSRRPRGLGRDLLRFGGASLLAEIILRTTLQEADPDLFQVLIRGLRRIETTADPLESVILAEAWNLIARLGFAPALDYCVSCGRSLDPDENTDFDYAAGGVRCTRCSHTVAPTALPGRARRALLALGRGQAIPLARTEGHWRLLSRYLDHHVLEGSTLRSLSFITSTLDGEPCTG